MEKMNQPYYLVIEEQEFEKYNKFVSKEKLLILDLDYKKQYEVFDQYGLTKSTGPGPARNFAWDHSIKNGFDWHWVMDDNINGFYRLNKNLRIRANTGAIFRAMEDFCLRYENIAMAGPNYMMFVPRKQKRRVLEINTRIYSCNLIRNDMPYRWRGRYNEDTDLSLRMLKDGWCTLQFNAFLQNKVRTQVLGGGNTAEFYKKEGTLPKSKMLIQMHPDVSKLAWKYGRWHHVVNYNPFKKHNILKKKTDLQIEEGLNEYGMTLNES